VSRASKEIIRGMEEKGSYIDVLINKKRFIIAFVDSGCLCLASVSQRFSQRKDIRRISIPPRRLEQVVNDPDPPQITEIAAFRADFDGLEEDLYAYIIPGQREDLILGKGWLKRHDASIRPAKEEVKIRLPAPLTLRTRGTNPKLKEVSPNALRAYRARACRSKNQDLGIFSATLEDIEKALRPKTYRDPREECPDWLRPVLGAFDRKKAAQLPPYRLGLDHEINLEEGKTVPSMPLYSMSRDELLVLRKTLYELLGQGFIRASSSGAGAPVIFVRKPGGGLRFCVDYRGLNAVTKKDRYPLPLIGETLRSIAGAKWVSKVDVISAFHRLRIREGDEWKTAFRTRLGSFEWLVTPFGLCGAPASFQRFINSVLYEWLDRGCSAYLDDVVIYSNRSKEEHRELVKKIIKALGDAGLQLDWEKSEFEAKQIKYLGFIVEPGVGLRADPAKVEAIRLWERPKNVRAVRSFLGFANYYRQFVKDYSRIAGPLTALTRKDQRFEWTDEEERAFQELKEALIQAPVLIAYDPEKETVVETDCSGYALGGVLRQRGEDGLLHPIAYHSRKLTPAEVNYPIHDKEMLAVLSTITEWRPMLQGIRFEVWTDHKNLEYFRTKQHLGERQRRWAYELSAFDFRIIHKAGKTQIQSDALSRREQDLPQGLEDERLKTRDFQLLQGDQEKGLTIIAKAWLANADEGPGELPTEEEQQDPPQCPFEDQELREAWEEALRINGRYWKARKAVIDGDRQFPREWGLPWAISECSLDNGRRLRWRGRIWIPFSEPLRTQLIQKIHDSTLSGHPGREITRDLIAREYMWPGLSQDVRRFVRNCETCGKGKIWREQKRGLLKPLPIPDRPWQELAMDFITGLPKSQGATAILAITDRLTKAGILIPMKKMESEDVAEALLTHVFSHHGLPRAIVSDRGPQFAGLFWGAICRRLGIKRRLSTAFHPETDGAQERSNQEIETYLRCYTTFLQDDWALHLPAAQLALNNRATSSTGLSPFFLNHGFHHQILEGPEGEEESNNERGSKHSPAEQGRQWLEKQRAAVAFAQASMAMAQEIQEKYANQGRQGADSFRVGDRVWLRLKNASTQRPSKKLDWLALPYKVIGLVGSHAVRLDVPRGIHPVFSVNLIKRAGDDPFPSQQNPDLEPPPIQADEASNDSIEGEYRIERVLRHRKRGRGWQVLVKWTGWTEPTWEPIKDLLDTQALEQYESTLQSIPWQ
jgi:transposase InsO family protein